ncbi:MAG: hypothetical protein WD042_14685 [Phycisphaeraceae bacterium]
MKRHCQAYRLFLCALLAAAAWGTGAALAPVSLAAETRPAAKPTADKPDLTLLSGEVWRDETFGVGFNLPLTATLRREVADDAVVHVIGDGGYIISLYIKKSKSQVNIDQVVQAATGQLAVAEPMAVLIAESEARPAGRPGALLYFDIPADAKRKASAHVLGEGFMQLDPTTVVMLRLDVKSERYKQAKPIFEAVFKSLSVEDPAKINERRAALIATGQEWHKALTIKDVKAALVPEQWFRIVAENRDIGYMQITQKADKQLNLEGVTVEVRARIEVGDQAYDSLSNFFVSDDRTREIWSIRTTVRPLAPAAHRPGAKGNETSWAETGLRSGKQVTVSREGPAGVNKSEWDAPTKGYLSQVELQMLGSLLPRNKEGEYGFYGYVPSASKISFRRERVEVAKDGTVTIHSWPTPEQPAQVSRSDANGRLLERTLDEGRKVIPTNKAELAAKWGVRWDGR